MASKRGLAAITDDALRNALGNMCLSKGVFADENGTAQVNATTAFLYTINGTMYSLGTGAKDLTARTDDGTITAPTFAAGTTHYMLLAPDSSGTVFAWCTNTVNTIPAVPDRYESTAGTWTAVDTTPVCLAKVVTAGTATYKAGSTNTNATNVTITYTTINVVPDSI